MLNKLRIEESQVPKMCLDLYREYGTTMAGLKVYTSLLYLSRYDWTFVYSHLDCSSLCFIWSGFWIIMCCRFWGTISTTTTSMPASMERYRTRRWSLTRCSGSCCFPCRRGRSWAPFPILILIPVNSSLISINKNCSWKLMDAASICWCLKLTAAPAPAPSADFH